MNTDLDTTSMIARRARAGSDLRPTIASLVDLAQRGLTAVGSTDATAVPFTYRGYTGPEGPHVRPEGRSLRYAAMAALGLSRVATEAQHAALGGGTAADLANSCLAAAHQDPDLGAVALSLWAAGEIAGTTDTSLIARLEAGLGSQLDTVVVAWSIVAAIAIGPKAHGLRDAAAAKLLEFQGCDGIYPHQIPPRPGIRAHVGSFADQIYPTQAFARMAAATADAAWLAVANRTAQRLVDLQGDQGQWWWHYDRRDGSVVEAFPVYSVHQHGMAPMVLFELAETGGDDHREAIAAGLRWLYTHPECVEPLIAPELGVVWRKVGRREPAKTSRALGAATTAIRPGLHFPGLDRILTPGRVDYECRPYELGWLLYAWADGTTKES